MTVRYESLNDQFLQCRTFGHSWDRRTDPKKTVQVNVIYLRCTVCQTKRNDVIDAEGNVASRTYEYPLGYQGVMKKGDLRNVLRLEVLRRAKKRRRNT